MSERSSKTDATHSEQGELTDRSSWPTRLGKLTDQRDDCDVLALSPAERIEMMWPLAVNAWAFMGVDVRGQQFQRHVVRVIRSGK